MYATTSACDVIHAVYSAPPRPLASRWMTSTSGSSSASASATANVLSVLALSAIVMRDG